MRLFSTPGIMIMILTLLSLGAFIYFSLQVHRAKGSTLGWRGIVKLVSMNGTPASLAAVYPRWFMAFCAFFFAGCLYVAYLVWGTDHSFLIVIFPLLFYYFFARYFLWEKADLSD